MIWYLFGLVILSFTLFMLNKYKKAYDKRFGKSSASFIMGELVIVIGVLGCILVMQFMTIY